MWQSPGCSYTSSAELHWNRPAGFTTWKISIFPKNQNLGAVLNLSAPFQEELPGHSYKNWNHQTLLPSPDLCAELSNRDHRLGQRTAGRTRNIMLLLQGWKQPASNRGWQMWNVTSHPYQWVGLAKGWWGAGKACHDAKRLRWITPCWAAQGYFTTAWCCRSPWGVQQVWGASGHGEVGLYCPGDLPVSSFPTALGNLPCCKQSGVAVYLTPLFCQGWLGSDRVCCFNCCSCLLQTAATSVQSSCL